MKLKDLLIIALIIIGFAILYLKPDKEVNDKQDEYDKKHDSVFVNMGKSEVKQYKTIQNVTNNIIQNNKQKVWYSNSDSLRLVFIDSTFMVEGL